jgi:hypothetical protein
MKTLISTHQVSNVGAWYQEHERSHPMRYQVLVRKFHRGEWEVMMGSLVTYLSPEDYCDMHGLHLVELFRGTRHALHHERTELI